MKITLLITISTIFLSQASSDLRYHCDGAPLVDENFTPRIIGGFSVDIQNYAFMVGILVDGIQMCGGSIIAPAIVLTAAHCVRDHNVRHLSQLQVRVGSSFRHSGGLLIPVVEKIINPDYIPGRPFGDLAILKLKSAALNRYKLPVETIELWNGDETRLEGTMASVLGWGCTNSREFSPSEQLQEALVPIVSYERCRWVHKDTVVQQQHICAGWPNGGQDACWGDSGGPLVIADKLAAVVASGLGCAAPGIPGVYTSVKAHREWIDGNLHPPANPNQNRTKNASGQTQRPPILWVESYKRPIHFA